MFYALQSSTAPAQEASTGINAPLLFEGPLPEGFDANAYHLSVTGLVEQPKQFDLDSLLRMPQENKARRMISADGWTWKAAWGGVSFRTLCNLVRPRTEARYLIQRNLLGEEESVELSVFLNGNALLALSLAAKPLTLLEGGPARTLPFNVYAHKGLSHVNELHFSTKPSGSRSTRLGYPESAAIKPSQYYAFDLAAAKPVHHGGEILEY